MKVEEEKKVEICSNKSLDGYICHGVVKHTRYHTYKKNNFTYCWMDFGKGEVCGNLNKGWICTELKGHEGNHKANHGSDVTWKKQADKPLEFQVEDRPDSCEISVNAKNIWSGKVKTYAPHLSQAMDEALAKAEELSQKIKDHNTNVGKPDK